METTLVVGIDFKCSLVLILVNLLKVKMIGGIDLVPAMLTAQHYDTVLVLHRFEMVPASYLTLLNDTKYFEHFVTKKSKSHCYRPTLICTIDRSLNSEFD